MRLITFTTDFGHLDWFVGVLKGAVLTRHSQARIVDLTHGIPPGDVPAGAFALLAAHAAFPRGTVHVAVVDPGVGSARAALALRTRDYYFVGPDNGVLSWALRGQRVLEVRRLTNRALWREPLSATFHGRDIFAPVAAHLSAGGRFRDLGEEAMDFIRLPWPTPSRGRGGWLGQVVYVDRFGNAITNLETASVLGAGGAVGWVVLPQRRRCRVGACYQAAGPGRLVAVPGSSGCLEIAVNGGSAAALHGLKVGSPIQWIAPEERGAAAGRT